MKNRLATNPLSTRILDRIFGAAGNQRLSILLYHRVLQQYDYLRPGDPDVVAFDWQMALLSRHCCPLSLEEALRLMDAGELPARAVCITFDDGYADNATLALPILKKYSIPATVFVSTAYLDGGRMWNDTVLEAVRFSDSGYIDLSRAGLGIFPLGDQVVRQKSAHEILTKIKHYSPVDRHKIVELIAEQSGVPADTPMLSLEQLKYLNKEGIGIGAHTHTHPILNRLDPADALEEIAMSKAVLEDSLGTAVRFFAYPNGKLGSDYDSIHRDMVSDLGFEAAVSTRWGVSNKDTDRWQLPRFTPWDASSQRFLFRLLWNQRDVVGAAASSQ